MSTKEEAKDFFKNEIWEFRETIKSIVTVLQQYTNILCLLEKISLIFSMVGEEKEWYNHKSLITEQWLETLLTGGGGLKISLQKNIEVKVVSKEPKEIKRGWVGLMANSTKTK